VSSAAPADVRMVGALVDLVVDPLCLVNMLADRRLTDLSSGKHMDVALYWQCVRAGGKLLNA
jgi:hypothetical protein